MNYSTFQTITVRQYQQLYEIHRGKADTLDKTIQSVCVLTGLSERGVEDLSMQEFNKIAAEITVIFSNLPKAEPKSFIRIGGKRFGIIYKPATLSAGQYIEIQTWMRSNLIENIHKIMASLVYPVKGVWPFWYRGKNNSENHPEISEKILDCNFMTVHSACVFFSKCWRDSINSLVPYLDRQTGKKGVSRKDLQTILKHATDGFLAPSGSQTSKT